MDTPLTITYLGMDGTPELDRLIEFYVEKLRQQSDRLEGVSVTLELEQPGPHVGGSYRVCIDAPFSDGPPFCTDFRPEPGDAAVTLQAAIQRAFGCVFREIEHRLATARSS